MDAIGIEAVVVHAAPPSDVSGIAWYMTIATHEAARRAYKQKLCSRGQLLAMHSLADYPQMHRRIERALIEHYGIASGDRSAFLDLLKSIPWDELLSLIAEALPIILKLLLAF